MRYELVQPFPFWIGNTSNSIMIDTDEKIKRYESQLNIDALIRHGFIIKPVEPWEQSLRDLLEETINKNRIQELIEMRDSQLYDEMDKMTVQDFRCILKAALCIK